jgi:hypothetical protein
MVDGPLWGIGLLHRENNGAERDGVEGVEGATRRRKGKKIKEKWKWAGWLAGSRLRSGRRVGPGKGEAGGLCTREKKKRAGPAEGRGQEGLENCKTFAIFLVLFKFKTDSNSNKFYLNLKLKHSINSK